MESLLLLKIESIGFVVGVAMGGQKMTGIKTNSWNIPYLKVACHRDAIF